MNQVWQESLKISEIKYAELPKFGFDKLGVQVDIQGQFQVHSSRPLDETRARVMASGCFSGPTLLILQQLGCSGLHQRELVAVSFMHEYRVCSSRVSRPVFPTFEEGCRRLRCGQISHSMLLPGILFFSR